MFVLHGDKHLFLLCVAGSGQDQDQDRKLCGLRGLCVVFYELTIIEFTQFSLKCINQIKLNIQNESS